MKKVINFAIWCFLVLSLNGCTPKYKELPIEVPFDVSKKGNVYETNFTVPFFWKSSAYGFFIEFVFDNEQVNKYRDFYGAISASRVSGYKNIPYFTMKITLTSLNRDSQSITYTVGSGYGIKVKEVFIGKSLIKTVDVPLFGGGSRKFILNTNLQSYEDYNVKIEVVKGIDIPDWISTRFIVKSSYAGK